MQNKWAIEGRLDKIMSSVVYLIASIVKEEKYFHDVYMESYLALRELITRYDTSLPLINYFGFYIRRSFQVVRELDYVVHYPSNVLAYASPDDTIEDHSVPPNLITEAEEHDYIDIKNLPPILKRIVCEEETIAEIAKDLNCSKQNIHSKLQKERGIMKKRIRFTERIDQTRLGSKHKSVTTK